MGGAEGGGRGNGPNESMNGATERSPKSIPVSRRNRDPGGVVAGPATGVGGGRRVRGGGFRTAKAVEPRTVASTLPPLSVAPRFPDSADRQVSESNSRSFTSASLFSPPHYFVLSVTLFLSPSYLHPPFSLSLFLFLLISFSFSLSFVLAHPLATAAAHHRVYTRVSRVTAAGDFFLAFRPTIPGYVLQAVLVRIQG